jgi:hypothetical protein
MAPYLYLHLQSYLSEIFLGFSYSAPCPAAISRLSYPPPASSVATREAFPQDVFTCLVASLDGLNKEQ